MNSSLHFHPWPSPYIDHFGNEWQPFLPLSWIIHLPMKGILASIYVQASVCNRWICSHLPAIAWYLIEMPFCGKYNIECLIHTNDQLLVHMLCRYSRGWFYHRELRLWLARIPHVEPLVKTQTYERGSYLCFDPNMWEIIRKVSILFHISSTSAPKAFDLLHIK